MTQPPPSWDATLSSEDWALLRAWGFDAQAFERNLSEQGQGSETLRAEDLAALLPQDLDELATLPNSMQEEARERGQEALRSGELALVILAGGMATRFGGGVKGLVELESGRTLLDLHRDRMATIGPLLLMTSFATHPQLHPWAQDREGVLTFSQGIAPRVCEDGSLLRDQRGRLSCAATGHGDLGPYLRSSGMLDRLREQGVGTLLVANVDNIATTPDPLLLGLHLAGGADVTVELAPRSPADRGGLPLRHLGTPRIVEDYLLPNTFDCSHVNWLNTNTLWIRTEALIDPPQLTWVTAHKQAEGQAIRQFERLVGELTAFLPTRFLCASRERRFHPIKSREDLPSARRWLRANS